MSKPSQQSSVPHSGKGPTPTRVRVLMNGIPINEYIPSGLRPSTRNTDDKAALTLEGDESKILVDNEAEITEAAEEDGGSEDSPKELKWPQFSLTLTPQEIEEDFLILTGSKPPNKASQKPEAGQNQPHNLFPGMGLGSRTLKDYEVPEGSKKSCRRGNE